MRTSLNTDLIFKSIVQVQKRMKPVLKGSENPYFKSNYANHEDVVNASQELLTEHGLAISQGGEHLMEVGWTLNTVLLHESGQWISFNHPMEPTKKDPQGYAAANTYAKRIGHMGIIGLASTDDDDGNEASFVDTKKLYIRPKGEVVPLKINPTPINAKMYQNILDVCKKRNIDFKAVSAVLKNRFNKTDAKTLTFSEYDDLMAELNAMGK